MTKSAFEVIARLQGRSLATAESCTGGGIGRSRAAFRGGAEVGDGRIIRYCNEIKEKLLNVPREILDEYGAVSMPVAKAMAQGARNALGADVAVSVTGIAGPSGDEFGNPVGTVWIGYADEKICIARKFVFAGDRESVRRQAVAESLKLLLENL